MQQAIETPDIFPTTIELAIGVQKSVLGKNLLLVKSTSHHSFPMEIDVEGKVFMI